MGSSKMSLAIQVCLLLLLSSSPAILYGYSYGIDHYAEVVDDISDLEDISEIAECGVRGLPCRSCRRQECFRGGNCMWVAKEEECVPLGRKGDTCFSDNECSNKDEILKCFDRKCNLVPLGSKLLYKEKGATYYGVPVKNGTTLTTGTVADTCDAAGMKAVCFGNKYCSHSSSRCQVVDFEDACNLGMSGLSLKLCGTDNGRKCPPLEGLFNYMKDRTNGECGIVNGDVCANGNNFTSGRPTIFHAYCVKT